LASLSFAADGGTDDYAPGEAPPGMKIEKVGDLNIRIPKDAEVRRTGKGGLLYVEGIDEYAARKLENMEDRIGELEKAQDELKEDDDLAVFGNFEINVCKVEV
jgi:hypothetical protein